MNYKNTLKSLLLNYRLSTIFVALLFFMNYLESNRFPIIVIGYYLETGFSYRVIITCLKVLIYLVFVTIILSMQFKNMLKMKTEIKYLDKWKHNKKGFLFLLVYYFTLFIIIVYSNDLVLRNNDMSLESIAFQVFNEIIILINYIIISIGFIKIIAKERLEVFKIKKYFTKNFFCLILGIVLLKTMLITLVKYTLIHIYQVDFNASFNLFNFFNIAQYNSSYTIINALLNSIMILVSIYGIAANYILSAIKDRSLHNINSV